MTPESPGSSGSLLSFPPSLQLFMSSYQTGRVLPNPPVEALAWLSTSFAITRELPLMILAGIGSFLLTVLIWTGSSAHNPMIIVVVPLIRRRSQGFFAAVLSRVEALISSPSAQRPPPLLLIQWRGSHSNMALMAQEGMSASVILLHTERVASKGQCLS